MKRPAIVLPALLLACSPATFASIDGVVIGQVDDGGNMGATHRHDFVEVYDAGSTPGGSRGVLGAVRVVDRIELARSRRS